MRFKLSYDLKIQKDEKVYAEILRNGDIWKDGIRYGKISDNGEIWIKGIRSGIIYDNGDIWIKGKKQVNSIRMVISILIINVGERFTVNNR